MESESKAVEFEAIEKETVELELPVPLAEAVEEHREHEEKKALIRLVSDE